MTVAVSRKRAEETIWGTETAETERGRKRMQQKIRDLGQKRDTESRIAGTKRMLINRVLGSFKLGN